ncbi:hypothetical protein Ae201684P_019370 [Aphanomyces euteiches]|nr:hypothetical protein Ae201684P_019370 [Aphanomyces euteiches]
MGQDLASDFLLANLLETKTVKLSLVNQRSRGDVVDGVPGVELVGVSGGGLVIGIPGDELVGISVGDTPGDELALGVPSDEDVVGAAADACVDVGASGAVDGSLVLGRVDRGLGVATSGGELEGFEDGLGVDAPGSKLAEEVLELGLVV